MGTKTSQTICILLIMTSMIQYSTQNTHNNKVEDENPFADIAASLLSNKQGGVDLAAVGGMLSNLMQSEEGKNLGGMLMQGLNNNAGVTNDILSGIGKMLTDGKGGIDPNMIGSVMSMLANADKMGTNEVPRSNQKHNDISNIGSILETVASGLAGHEGMDGISSFLPILVSTLNSFTDDEAVERVKEHSSHSWLVPPVIEQIHIFFDHFQHSELGKNMNKKFGINKLFKMFTGEDGKFDFDKMVSLLENHSFRRHWLSIATNYLADMVGYIADPKIQKKYFTTAQLLLNGFLKEQGFPKTALFEASRASESISSLINILLKKTLGMKFESMPYVKPIVKYFEDLLRTAQTKSMKLKSGIDSREISNKLTDTINLEIIEPVLRVFRAYRYAKKVPQCDMYVMCLINQDDPKNSIILPKLKRLLSRTCSVFASWFLSSHTHTPFWSLYTAVVEESNCQQRYPVDCSDFHAEEIRVTTEYIHNEL